MTQRELYATLGALADAPVLRHIVTKSLLADGIITQAQLERALEDLKLVKTREPGEDG